ncbi:MAG TPA: Gfo/Idh/MocA family oxidoreductase [Gemmataceae bacterium]|nr:Gfo/Idh/MocA family oxidoreductase [Gemmataceae bacterium]
MEQQNNRREFLKDTTLAGVGFWVAGGLALTESRAANEKVNFACIGVGGKGDSDTSHVGQLGNVVALCDIDDNTLNRKAEQFPKAKKYNDFRKMLDEIGKEIDAVTVSTPDHTHAPASVMAMKMGKHVYCQKPLTHSVYEARLMRETAQRQKVATQMGNQGTASNGLRRAVEIIQAGAIGPVHEVHVWTNRPIWPQGPEAILKVGAARSAALAALHGTAPSNLHTAAPPSHVHWDLFLGPAPARPYDPIYHPFNWRGWWDFGTGALGDMACHTANMAFMALKLGYPTSIEAQSDEINQETYPMWARIAFDFPSRGEMPPVRLYWYEGNNRGRRVLPPIEAPSAGGRRGGGQGRQGRGGRGQGQVGGDSHLARWLQQNGRLLPLGQSLSDSGSLLVGEKGILFSPNDYGQSYTLLPEKEFAGYKGPPETLPRNGKDDPGQKAEWVAAIKGGPPALSNFNYAALLTETILLGNVAMRVGKKLEWDGPSMRVKNAPEAEKYIKPEFRQGWTL